MAERVSEREGMRERRPSAKRLAPQRPLSKAWTERRAGYDFVVVGSGYGGAAAAAGIATAAVTPKPTLCILERGREWRLDEFPETPRALAAASSGPGALFEFRHEGEVSLLQGAGLGGGSLINAGVVLTPEPELLDKVGWPAGLGSRTLLPIYEEARQVLGAVPHPRAAELSKVRALDRRAGQLGRKPNPLPVAVNFTIDGVNAHGVPQQPCTDCGNCLTGCNFGAKNTLATNFLPMARRAGAEIYTQVEVEWVEKGPSGGWRVHGRRIEADGSGEVFAMDCRNVVLAAGAVHTTEILLRSAARGLSVSPLLGRNFSAAGDILALAYNGEAETNVLGYGRRSPSPGEAAPPGPSVVAAVDYVQERFLVHDVTVPSGLVAMLQPIAAMVRSEEASSDPNRRERQVRDLTPGDPYHRKGALNHSMLYAGSGRQAARGAMRLTPEGRGEISWRLPDVQVLLERAHSELREHARALGAAFVPLPGTTFELRPWLSVRPVGGCPIGEDEQHGAADQYGRVFAGDGGVHEGLFVADGALLPGELATHPLLSIAALAGHVAERKVRELRGESYPARRPAVAAGAPAAREAEPAPEFDPLLLAWRLVLAQRVAPDLLESFDAEKLVQAVRQVSPSRRGREQLRHAQDELERAQPGSEPHPLWLAWMRTTRGKSLDEVKVRLIEEAEASVPTHATEES